MGEPAGLEAEATVYNKGALCPQCGPQDRVDEDGCCTGCGCVAVGDGVDANIDYIAALKRERDELRATVERVESAVRGLSGRGTWWADLVTTLLLDALATPDPAPKRARDATTEDVRMEHDPKRPERSEANTDTDRDARIRELEAENAELQAAVKRVRGLADDRESNADDRGWMRMCAGDIRSALAGKPPTPEASHG